MRRGFRRAASALLAAALIAGAPAASRAGGGAQNEGLMQMRDLLLSLDGPGRAVLTGEDFVVTLRVANTGPSTSQAPALGADDAFVLRLAPSDGGAPIALSAHALRRMQRPRRQGSEPFFPRPSPRTDTLTPGETREFKLYPATLAPRPIPPGEYAMTAALLLHPEIVSPATTIVVEAARVASLATALRGVIEGVDLSFLHRVQDGRFVLFHGLAPAQDPARIAALRVTEIEAAGDAAPDLAVAQRFEGGSGPSWTGWLTADGRFGAALAYSAFVAGEIAPIALGLEDATLHPIGWQDSEDDGRAAFAVLGRGATGPELVIIRIDGEADWATMMTRAELPLDAAPTLWRMGLDAETGEMTLVAVMTRNEAAQALALRFDAAGAALGEVETLATTPHPVAALSVSASLGLRPEDEDEDEDEEEDEEEEDEDDDEDAEASTEEPAPPRGPEAQLLLGPVMQGEPRMILRRLSLDGGPETETAFLVPTEDGAAPEGWTLAEGAPPEAAIAALLGPRLLSVRIAGAASGAVLTEDAANAEALTTLAIGNQAWVLWRTAVGEILGLPFE